MSIKDAIRALPYRPGVGIMLLDRLGRVFVAQRIDMPSEAWQRLWSFAGAIPTTLLTFLKGRLKKGQRSMWVAPGTLSISKSAAVGRYSRAPALIAAF